jgi:DNA-directed RNA polymerase subunit RPC12/RpoP
MECPECGAEFDGDLGDMDECPVCGFEVPDEACAKCGESVGIGASTNNTIDDGKVLCAECMWDAYHSDDEDDDDDAD